MNGTEGGPGIPEITATELRARLERADPLVLVDVREPFERDIADLPEVGQLRIPVGEIVERAGELDREAELVLYCRSGSRSGWATQQLLEKGFASVLNLRGGILAWRSEVDPSVRAY